MLPGTDITATSADFTKPEVQKTYGTFIHYYAKCTQYFAWVLFWLPFHGFYRAEIRGRENLKDVSAPVVIIANHIRFFDSFFFRFAFAGYPKLWPIRFMAVRKFFSSHLNFLNTIGIIPLVYGLFAVFLINSVWDEKKPGESLSKATTIIKSGDNVMIYPEGKIYSNDIVGPFRRGAAVLAQTNHVLVLPASFRIVKDGSFRKHLYINIGKQITLPDNNTVEENTALLQKEVEVLFQKI